MTCVFPGCMCSAECIVAGVDLDGEGFEDPMCDLCAAYLIENYGPLVRLPLSEPVERKTA